MQMLTAVMKLKDACPLEEKLDQPRQHIKKQRYYFADKGPSSQGYGFSSSHVWIWELDYKESWVPKNWCFWIVVLEKTLESPLDCKEIQPVHPKGNESWVFIGRTDVEAEIPILWPPDEKSWLIGKDTDTGKDWGQEEKGTTEDEMVGWHHRLDGHGFGWTQGVGDRQGGLACCRSWGRKESDTTERLNWYCACMLNYFSHLFATLWTLALQAPLGFSRQEYWSGLPGPSQGNLPDPGTDLASLLSPALAGGFFTTSTTGKPLIDMLIITK